MKKILIIIVIIVLNQSALAVDIPLNINVGGGTSLQLHGDWMTGINFEKVNNPLEDTVSTWDSTTTLDWIEFSDDSELDGFEIMLTVGDFIYEGSAADQQNIPAENIRIYANYDPESTKGLTATKATDDPTKTLNIASDSCPESSPNTFTFHKNFTKNVENFSIKGTNASQTILTSKSNCLAQGELRIQHIEATIPAESKPGQYKGSITLTIIDGN